MSSRRRRRLHAQMYGADANHLKRVREAPDAAAPRAHREPAPPPGEPSVDEMHPSWIAKRQQLAALASAPAGKKLVFGDDGEAAEEVTAAPAPPRDAAPVAEQLKAGKRPRDSAHAGPARAEAVRGRGAASRGAARGARGGAVRGGSAGGCGEGRGAIIAARGARGRGDRGRGTSRSKAPAARAPPNQLEKEVTGPLHPSWEAKKLQRAQAVKQAKLIASAPRGKKMTFDDSD